MKIDLVVARHNEDVRWIHQISAERFVIDKSASPYVSAGVTTIQLPNVGREAESYLYALNEYKKTPDTSPDWIIFSQGHPFDHCPHFVAYAGIFVQYAQTYKQARRLYVPFMGVVPLDVADYANPVHGVTTECEPIASLFGGDVKKRFLSDPSFHTCGLFAVHRERYMVYDYEKALESIRANTINAWAMEKAWRWMFDY